MVDNFKAVFGLIIVVAGLVLFDNLIEASGSAEGITPRAVLWPGPHPPVIHPPGPTPPPPSPPPRPSKPRFLGTTTLNPEFYARDFGRIASEVIQHLATVDGVELQVRLEITAVANKGFDEAKVRTIAENAQTLKVRAVRVRSRVGTRTHGIVKQRCPG